MDQESYKHLNEFQVYDDIISGPLRPHLSQNNRVEHLREQFIQAVCANRGIDKAKVSPEVIGYPPPLPYVRYNDVCLQEGDVPFDVITPEGIVLRLSILDNGGSIKRPSSLNSISAPTSIKEAYYLFLIEEVYYCIQKKLPCLLSTLSSSELKDYSRRQLQLLKLFAGQAQQYGQQLESSFSNEGNSKIYGYFYKANGKNKSITRKTIQEERQKRYCSSMYVVEALQEHIISLLLTFQETFQPYHKMLPLSEKEIRKDYISPKKASKDTSKQPAPATWHSLFKEPKAADHILKLLREEGYISSDRQWLTQQPLRMMVALYLVLRDRGYLKPQNHTSKLLCELFNKQFKTSFTSRNWQPDKHGEPEKLKDSFGLVKEYRPQDYKS